MAALKHALVLATICGFLVAASHAQDSPAPDPTSGDGSGNAQPAVSLNVTVEAAAQAAGLGPTAAAASLNVNIGGGDGSWGSANAVVIADAGYVFDQSVDDGAVYKISQSGAIQPIWSGSPLTNPIAILPNAGPLPFTNPGGHFVGDYKSCFIYLPFYPYNVNCPDSQNSPKDGVIYWVKEDGSAPIVVYQGAPLVNPAGLGWAAPNKLMVSDYGYENRVDGKIYIIDLDPNNDGRQGPFPVPSSAITTLSGSPIDPAYSAPYKRGFIVGDAGGSLLSVQQQGLFQKSYTTSQFAAGPLSQAGPWQPTGISRQGGNLLFGDFFKGVFSTPLDGNGGAPRQLITSPCPNVDNKNCSNQDLRRFLGMDAATWQTGAVMVLNTIIRHDLKDTVTGVPLDQEFPPRVLQVNPSSGGFSVFYPPSGQSADPLLKTPFDIKFVKNDYFAQEFKTMLGDILKYN